MTNIGVLASGRGSNLQAIINAVDSKSIKNAKIVVVISDKEDAYSLERARKNKIDAIYINPRVNATREEYDDKVAAELKKREVDLVLLAGYMRIVTPKLIDPFKGKIMNIHPALLPSFPGLHAQRQALEWGVKVTGCTVHFVDNEVDHGPIVLQAAVPIIEGDTEETLSRRILEEEHIIYAKAVKWFQEGRLKIEGRQVRIKGVRQAGQGLRVL
jgi:phosphoribosylglycinamide formyltransferase 1